MDANPNWAGVQIAPGNMLSPDFEGFNEVSNGHIDYALTQILPNPPVSGNGTLVRITFRGKANGASQIGLDSILLSDHLGAGIATTRQNGVITVGAGAPTPTFTPVLPTATATPIPPTAAPTTPAPVPTTATPLPATATPLPAAATRTPAPAVPTAVPPTPAPVAPPVSLANFNCAHVLGYHVVQRGETLYAIARAYQVQPHAIAACNQLADPRRIHAGNRLAIPNAPWIPTPAGPTAMRQWEMGALAFGCWVNHTVRTGDTLTLIAGRYGGSVWTIVRANALYNPNLIYIGQVLCIP